MARAKMDQHRAARRLPGAAGPASTATPPSPARASWPRRSTSRNIKGYRVGGTIHLIINNQLGFTTPPEAARSSEYPTDVAKMVQAPIFHVNGDDPEACVRVARLAFAYRQRFHKDVVIDMVCYRRHGHNEGDDPSYTQPLMYRRIDARRSVRKLYTEALVKRGDISLEEAEAALDDFQQPAADRARRDHAGRAARRALGAQPRRRRSACCPTSTPASPRDELDAVFDALDRVPEGFTVHPKLAKQFEAARQDVPRRRRGRLGAGRGPRLRLAAARGHLGAPRRPGLAAAARSRSATPCSSTTRPAPSTRRSRRSRRDGAHFWLYDSLLSEFAALGFEYGYSVANKDALVIWEAQFGDFVNGAQVIIDQFIVAAEDKWDQTSGLVMLLPHGYEGQGPEHSLGPHRALPHAGRRGQHPGRQRHHRGPVLPPAAPPDAAATSASRWSSSRPSRCCGPRRRARRSTSSLSGSFQEVLDDPGVADPAAVQPGGVRLGQGRRRGPRRPREGRAAAPVAIARVEQLYPWPYEGVAAVLDAVPQRRRDRLAPGGAREHGPVELHQGPPVRGPRDTHTHPAGSAAPSRAAPPPAPRPSTTRSRKTCFAAIFAADE